MVYHEECNGNTFERRNGVFYLNGRKIKTKPFKIDFVLIVKVVALFFAGALFGGLIIAIL